MLVINQKVLILKYMSGLKISKVREHLKSYIGWYVMAPSIYLALAGESEIWLVIVVVLLKMPPFDLIGRYEQWLYRKMKVEERGLEMRAQLKKKPRYIRFLVSMAVLALLVVWMLYGPECVLC